VIFAYCSRFPAYGEPSYLPPPLPPFGRPHRLGLPMVVCVECLPADKPWDVVSVTRRSSGVAPRACVRVYARVLVPPNLYIHTYIVTLV